MANRSEDQNPFFEVWNTPFGLAPFDKIAPEHSAPAFTRALIEHDAEIAAIAGAREPANFQNVIEALERSGRSLRRVGRVVHMLVRHHGGGEGKPAYCGGKDQFLHGVSLRR
jgi:peptidyl-dipeptidase Dcp